jgi:hypothetical protein
MLLQVWQVLLYGGFAESVGVKARVALLQAHAQCANLAQAFGRCSSSSSGGTSKDPAAAAADDDALGVSRPGCFSPNSTINNELCCSIVVKSQAPYLDMLLLLWWGVLLDYAAFNSTLPGVMQNHKSLLFGHTYPEVVEAVQGTYAAAWPSVLIAVASNLPGPQQLIAATASGASSSSQVVVPAQQQDPRQAAWSAFVDLVSSGTELVAKGGGSSSSNSVSSSGASAAAAVAADKAAELWHQQLLLQCRGMHAVLLEVCLMMLSEAAAACAAALAASHQQQQQQQVALPAAAVAAARRVAVSLQAVQLLLTRQHIQAGLASVDVCADVTRALAAVAQQVLLPWLQLAQWSHQHQQQQQDQSLTVGMAALQLFASSSADAAANSQSQPDSASVARDKVFGAVLLASCELLQGIAAATCCQPGSSQPQPAAAAAAAAAAALDGEAAAALSGQVLETVLALSSIAVPFVEPAGSCGAAAEQVSYMPAFTEAVQQQQQLSSSSSEANHASLQTWQPSSQAAAACSSLCRTAAWLTQQQQQQTGLQATEAVWLLALRLALTAAPGQQLLAAQQLLEACLQGCAACIQQQSAHSAAVSACNTMCDAVTAAVQQSCSSSSAQPVLLDATARLPVLLTGLLQAAACCCSCPDEVPACTAAVDRCCGVLVWALKQYQPRHLQQQQQLNSSILPAAAESGLVAVRVLEALRLLLQDAASATGQQQQGRGVLAQQCAAAVTPQVGADGMAALEDLLASVSTKG